MDRVSTHPAFFNSTLGYIQSDNVSFSTLEIGHDAWIGFRATITPKCNRIGIGAIVGAGAVVTKDVPDFGIAVGNPARMIKQRFPDDVCALLIGSQWWKHALVETTQRLDCFTSQLTGTSAKQLLFRIGQLPQ